MIRNKKCLLLILLSSFLLISGLLSIIPHNYQAVMSPVSGSGSPFKATVILDPGHGGSDPGKIGTTGVLEKDINLTIALRVKTLLELADIEVLMTRTTDTDLSSGTSNKKVSDLKNRVDFIQKSNASLVVSIHQNSFPSPSVEGAQCFYFTHSPEGEQLAALLQQQIISSTNQIKIREIKRNEDYYLLKNSPLTTVIVECGFLSNPKEETLLTSQDYQEQMAWAIHLGILQFLNQGKGTVN